MHAPFLDFWFVSARMHGQTVQETKGLVDTVEKQPSLNFHWNTSASLD